MFWTFCIGSLAVSNNAIRKNGTYMKIHSSGRILYNIGIKCQIHFMPIVSLCVVCCLTFITLSSCSHSADAPIAIVGDTPQEVLLTPRPIIYYYTTPPDFASEDIGVTLEFTGYTRQMLSLVIANDSDYDIKYGNGYEISGDYWGYAGEADYEYYNLLAGEREKTFISLQDLPAGEFRIAKNIVFTPEYPAGTRSYELHTEFSIDNDAIPTDMRSVSMEADPDFTTSIGAVFRITNGFDSGRIYFDKYYLLQRNVNGAWQDIPLKSSDDFSFETHSLASRQELSLFVYWEWLYGELPPGEYRVGKSFLHRADDMDATQYQLYATFTVDGKPIPQIIHRDNSEWAHPFSNISTFRAVVKECHVSDVHHVSHGNMGLLVNELKPPWGENAGKGDAYYIWDNLSVAVLDPNNKQIKFSDIPEGAIVDITFAGIVLSSLPAHVNGTLLIQIIE